MLGSCLGNVMYLAVTFDVTSRSQRVNGIFYESSNVPTVIVNCKPKTNDIFRIQLSVYQSIYYRQSASGRSRFQRRTFQVRSGDYFLFLDLPRPCQEGTKLHLMWW